MTHFPISPLSALTLLLTLLNPIAFAQTIIPPVLHGRQILDLFFDNFADFSNLVELWNPVGITAPPKYFDDNGIYYFGGLNIFEPGSYVERTYDKLPSHITIYYIITVTVVGTWTTSDMFSIYLDDSLTSSWDNLPITTSPPDADEIELGPQIFDIVGSKSHNSNTLKLKIQSNFVTGSAVASFGIRKIQFLLSTAPNTDPKGTCTKNINDANTCNCNTKWYDAGSSGCFQCNINCQECFGGQPSQCYGCADGSYFNGVQCAPCHPSCLHCTGPNANQCTICKNPGEILNWDYTCSVSCLYSMEGSGQYLVCRTPCQAANKYLLWDGATCSDTCDAPLTAEIQGQAKFCKFGCDNANNEYLYWNGTCSQTCTNYPHDQGGYKFCESCQPGYFMYKDGNCQPSCPIEYQRVIGQSGFCDFPCYGEKKYLYVHDSSCRATCSYPYLVQSGFYCVIDLPKDEVEQAETIGGALGGSGKAASAVANVGSLFSAGNPAAIFLMTLTEMLQYIKFMKIRYPPKLQQILDTDVGNSFEMFPDLSEDTANSFGQYTLPEKFEQYQLQSSFFVNFWQQTMTLLTILMIILFTSISLKYTERFPLIQKILHKIKLTLKWNFALMMFTSYYGNIAFYTSFEFRTIHIKNFASALSLLAAIGFIFFAIFVFVKMINIIRDIRKPLTQTKRLGRLRKVPSPTSKWKEFEVIFEACKNSSFLQQAFMPVFVGRLVLFNMIIGYLFEYPLAQAILITLMSASMFLFLAIVRPFKDKLDLIEYLIQEIIILIVDTCVLILGILDAAGAEALDARYNLGEVIIGANIAFSSIALFYMILQMIVNLKNLYYVLIKAYNTRKMRRQAENGEKSDAKFNKQLDMSSQHLNPNNSSIRKTSHKGSFENSIFPETSSSQIFPINYEYNFGRPNIAVHPASPKMRDSRLDQSINVSTLQNEILIETIVEKSTNIFRRRSKKTTALIV